MKLRLKTSAAVAALLVGGATTLAVAQGQGASSIEKQPSARGSGDASQPKPDNGGSRAGKGAASGDAGTAKSGGTEKQGRAETSGSSSAPDMKQSGSDAAEKKSGAAAGTGSGDAGKKASSDQQQGGTTKKSEDQKSESDKTETKADTKSGTQGEATKGQASGQAGTGSEPKENQKAGRTGEGPASGTTGEGTPAGSAGATTGAAAGADTGEPLSRDQQTRIRERIGRTADRQRTNVNFNVSIGVAVPQTVELQPLPPDVIEVVPRYRGYRFVVVEDRIVIVHPERRTVVYVVERNGGRASTGRAAGAGGAGTRITLTSEERDMLSRVVERRSERIANVEIRVGTRLPRDVEIREFPDRIVREVPKLRPYHYVALEEEIVIVEPQAREIVLVVER